MPPALPGEQSQTGFLLLPPASRVGAARLERLLHTLLGHRRAPEAPVTFRHVPQKGERKLAAILSADVFGYSRLMAEDEAATVRTITAYREQVGALVREHRGRVADFSGDNFLAEFPTALDSVECAVEIQRVLSARNAGLPADRKMEFRIGVHLGDVRVEGERLYGDGVNIAARLEALAEPGGVCISATIHEQVRNHLDVGFEDLGDRTVKNVPDQVHAYQVRLDGRPAAFAPTPAAGSKRRRTLLVAGAVVLAAALVIWASWPRLLGLGLDLAGVLPSENPALPDLPSVVVLPFANMSGDPEQAYFADGITEDLTTALSGASGLFVISRNSAFTYKGRAVRVEDVGRELGVRYVLEGSVRKAGDQVRITAQLIDATTGFHVWSDKFDRRLEDIFTLQSEISEQILGAVGASISEAELERIRRKPTESLTAYDAFARAQSHFFRFRREDHREARRLLERAVELDPGYAAAVSMLGSTYSSTYGLLWSLDPALLDRGESYMRRAIELDPSLALPYMGLAAVSLARQRPERALPSLERARVLAPSDYGSYVFSAIALTRLGRQTEALEHLRKGFRLNPRIAGVSQASLLMAGIYANSGRTEEAVALWQQVREANPDIIMARLNLADYRVEAGDLGEARTLVEEALRVQPALKADDVLARGVVARLADAESFRANLRKAGLP
jgi:TolB-like protein/class 3 adenylate cyclase/Tfp pilus assembly protein PilF